MKNYIDQSQEFALCAAALAYPIVMLLRAKRIAFALLLCLLALSFIANMAFVIVSRTALVTMPIMLAVFGLLHLRWRTNLAILCAAAVLGVNTFYFKLMAFWVSSLLGGMAGALMAFCYYRAVTPEQFNLDVSIQLLAMVIVGGLASVTGSFLGAALVFFAPIVLNNAAGTLADGLGLQISGELRSHIPLILYGGLIAGFLLFEPLGLAKIWDNIRNYFLVWPFRHTRHS